MDKNQKEALVLALLEKAETYREIARKAGVSPNTIKAIANKSGLDESTSISSRAFELFSEGKTPLEVAVELNLEAEKAILCHQQYYMLLGCTEFTKVYLQIKDNPWPYVNLVQSVQDARIGNDEVVELLKIANGNLPRVRLEYDRLNWEKSSLISELNSWRAAVSNEVRVYQDFCDRNLALKNREDELVLSISELEAKKAELQNTILTESISEFQGKAYNTNVNLEVEQKEVIPINDVFTSSSNRIIGSHPNENKILHYPFQVEPSSRTLIFDTKDLF